MWSPEEAARHARDARRLAIAVAVLLAWWAAGRLAVGPSFGPGGAVFAVFVVLFCSFGAGRVVARFPPMPALLGQLVAGFLLRNIPTVGDAVGAAVDARFSAAARTAALGIVLARAGLSLDVKAVYRLRWAIKRLAFGPATAEALVVTLLAKPALGLPWSHCAALGVPLRRHLARGGCALDARAAGPRARRQGGRARTGHHGGLRGRRVRHRGLRGGVLLAPGHGRRRRHRRRVAGAHADRRRRAGRVGRREAPGDRPASGRERARYEHDNVDAENERAADERASDAWRHAVFGGDDDGNGRRIRPARRPPTSTRPRRAPSRSWRLCSSRSSPARGGSCRVARRCSLWS